MRRKEGKVTFLIWLTRWTVWTSVSTRSTQSIRSQPVTREVRAANARAHINTHFDAMQQVFLDFVLQHYIAVGVEELDQEKLTPLLKFKYHDSLEDAVAGLGSQPEEIQPEGLRWFPKIPVSANQCGVI